MKLRVIDCIFDRGYNDVEEEVFEYNLPEGTTLRELVEHHLRIRDNFDQEEIDNFRNMIETGRWFGGEWIDKGEYILFNTDVGWTLFKIVE